MILKTPYGLSPSFNLTIGGAAVDYQAINSIEIEMEANKHDLMTFDMAGIPSRAVTEYRNKPVRLTFDTGPGYADEFSGYIVEVCPHDSTSTGMLNGSQFQNVVIKCIGASYIMRGAKSDRWENSTIENVVNAVATKYGFSYDVPHVAPAWPIIIQDNESDWQFLVRYAGLLGLQVSAHNTHIHVYDPFKAAERQISFNRLITNLAANGSIAPVPGKIADFRGSFADRHANGVYKNTLVTVQQDNGAVYDVTSQDVFNVTGTALVEDRISGYVDSYADAEFAIQSRSKGEYDYDAQVLVGGLAGCQPGGIVDLHKYNAEYDGLWVVESVKHTLTSSAFISELSIRKNAISELSQRQTGVKFRPPPAPVFDGVAWRASRKQVHRVY